MNEMKVKAKELGINLTRGIAARYRPARVRNQLIVFKFIKLEEKFDHQCCQFSQTNSQVELTIS